VNTRQADAVELVTMSEREGKPKSSEPPEPQAEDRDREPPPEPDPYDETIAESFPASDPPPSPLEI